MFEPQRTDSCGHPKLRLVFSNLILVRAIDTMVALVSRYVDQPTEAKITNAFFPPKDAPAAKDQPAWKAARSS